MIGSIEFAHRMARNAGTSMPIQSHSCHELVYYLSGRGKTRIGTSEYDYEPFTYAFINPFSPHDEHRTEATDVVFVGFQILDPRFELDCEGVHSDHADRRINKLLLAIESEMMEKNAHYADKLNLLIGEMVIELYRCAL